MYDVNTSIDLPKFSKICFRHNFLKRSREASWPSNHLEPNNNSREIALLLVLKQQAQAVQADDHGAAFVGEDA